MLKKLKTVAVLDADTYEPESPLRGYEIRLLVGLAANHFAVLDACLSDTVERVV